MILANPATLTAGQQHRAQRCTQASASKLESSSYQVYTIHAISTRSKRSIPRWYLWPIVQLSSRITWIYPVSQMCGRPSSIPGRPLSKGLDDSDYPANEGKVGSYFSTQCVRPSARDTFDIAPIILPCSGLWVMYFL